MKYKLWILSVITISLLGLIILVPVFVYVHAFQLDPTAQQQTIDAIVNPRLTWTAQSVSNQTATALDQAVMTDEALQTATVLETS